MKERLLQTPIAQYLKFSILGLKELSYPTQFSTELDSCVLLQKEQMKSPDPTWHSQSLSLLMSFLSSKRWLRNVSLSLSSSTLIIFIGLNAEPAI